jgi:hypothetical protein
MIDIDRMSIAELEALLDRIHDRLKLLDNMRAHQSMMAHNLGDKVCFDGGQRGYQVGTLIKFNRKTVNVVADDGRQWRIPPHIMRPFKEIDESG